MSNYTVKCLIVLKMRVLRGAYLLKLLPVVVLLLKCAYVTLEGYYVGDAQVAKS